jgi:hypothetical protein
LAHLFVSWDSTSERGETATILGKRALNLATALVLGASIVALTAAPAAAESTKPKDTGVRCSMTGDLVGSENDLEFYKPGEWIEAKAGPTRTAVYECKSDGTWKQVIRTSPRVPGQLPSGIFTQRP